MITLSNVPDALRWMRDTPHWSGAAHPELAPTAMILSGDTAARIPTDVLAEARNLYDVNPDVGRMLEQPRDTWRMFTPTPTGHAYLAMVNNDVRFEKESDGRWSWICGTRQFHGLDTLFIAAAHAWSVVESPSGRVARGLARSPVIVK